VKNKNTCASLYFSLPAKFPTGCALFCNILKTINLLVHVYVMRCGGNNLENVNLKLKISAMQKRTLMRSLDVVICGKGTI
jgi:hypothetical protein